MKFSPSAMRHVFRGAIFLFLALSLLPQPASSLSEYAYLLEETRPSAWKLFLLPRPCAHFNSVNIEGLPLEKAQGYPQTIEAYAKAKFHLQAAKKMSSLQVVPTASIYQLASFVCFTQGANAAGSLAAGTKSALGVLGKQLSELSFLQGSEEGLGWGVLEEAREAGKKIETTDSRGESLGARFSSASQALSALWKGYPLHSNFATLGLVASKESLLSEAFIFGEKTLAARDGLYSSLQEADERLADLKDNSKLVLSRLEREGLESVHDELLNRQAGEKIIVVGRQGGFFEDVSGIRNSMELAALREREAERLEKEKKQGWLAKSVKRKAQAVFLLEDSIESVEDALERARKTEMGLRQSVSVKESEIDAMLAKKQAQPLSYSHIYGLRQDYYEWKDKLYSIQPLGTRINFLLQALEKLEKVSGAGKSADALEFGMARVRGMLEELEGTIKKAEGDDVGVEQEKQEALELSKRMNALGESEKTPEFLLSLEREIESIRNSVLSKADLLYSQKSRKGFADALEVESLLTPEKREKLGEYARYFSGGELQVADALGNLKEMSAFTQEEAGEIAANSREIVERELLENLAIQKVSEPAGLGQQSSVRAYATTENSLPLEAEGVEIPLPPEFANSKLVSADEGVFLRLGNNEPRLVIEKATKSQYSAVLEYEAVLARLDGESERTLYAGYERAEKEITISFTASEDADVLIRRSLPLGASYAIKTTMKYDDSSTNSEGSKVVSIVAHAIKGKNTLAIAYDVLQPFSLARNMLHDSPESKKYELLFANNVGDLQAVAFEMLEAPCRVGSYFVRGLGGLQVSATAAGEALLIEVKAGGWKDGETKIALIEASCLGTGGSQESAYNLTQLLELAEQEIDKNRGADDSKSENGEYLREEARQRIAQAEGACTQGCTPQLADLVSRMYKSNALGEYGEVISDSESFKQKASIQAEKDLLENEAKQATLSEYASSRGAATSTLEEYAKAFSVSQENAPDLKKSELYKSASAAAEALSRQVKLLDKLHNYAETGDWKALEAYSQTKLENELSKYKDALSQLQQANVASEKNAEKEISLAEGKGRQAGEGDAPEISTAIQAHEEGSYMTAYLVARRFNETRLPSPRGQVETGSPLMGTLAGIGGLLLLLVLAYFFLFKSKAQEQKLIK